MNKIVEKLWTGSFIKIALVNFFIFVNFHALLPTFPYFVEWLGGDSVVVGLATALFSVASIISRPFVGWFVDTKGRRTILVIGLIGMSILPMGYFFASGIAFAVLMRTFHGAFHAASSNAASTWVADIVPHTRMGEGLGMFGLSMALSTAAAPAIGLTIMHNLGFKYLFVATTIAAVIALVIGITIKDKNYKPSTKPLKISELFEKMSMPASITQFFFMMAYGVIEVYVAMYATSNNLPDGGVYFICIAIATVLSRILLGKVVDKRGEGILVYSGNIAIIIGIILLVFLHNTPSYILSALLLGYSFGAVQPSLQTMSMHAVAPERRGAASSTFFCAFDLGIALGGFLAGILIKYLGYDNMFLCIAFSCVLSLLYYFIFGRKHVSSMNPCKQTQLLEKTFVDNVNVAEAPLVITISREYGSGGREIGQLLADRLGIKLYDNKLIDLTATESGLDKEFVEANEQKLRNSLLYDLYPNITGHVQQTNSAEQAMFFAQSKIIRDLAQEGSCVIVGRLANFILKDQANCFNIFVHANESFRLQRVVTKYGINQQSAATELLNVDKEREEHCRHYTGKTWGAYKYYHLSIDSSFYGIEGAVNMLEQVIKEKTKGK